MVAPVCPVFAWEFGAPCRGLIRGLLLRRRRCWRLEILEGKECYKGQHGKGKHGAHIAAATRALRWSIRITEFSQWVNPVVSNCRWVESAYDFMRLHSMVTAHGGPQRRGWLPS